MNTALPVLKAGDFGSDQDVRWCPGCGDYSILAQMKKILPDVGIPPHKIVFVSGIGCSSRFPYYMNTYGMHTIHGRAPAVATGLKIANPDLTVFVITGDGDSLSIGGNHLLHLIRRNVDLNIILFNNRIYGLTKGQYSPTSLQGHVTKSTPGGSLDYPLNPLSVVLGADATFVARSIDFNTKHLGETLYQATQHRGTSFVEVLQNCNVFNDGAWEHLTDKDVKDDNLLVLHHGKPMVYGKNNDKGVRLQGLTPQSVVLGGAVNEQHLLVHDQSAPEPHIANLLARFSNPDLPVPIGVFRQVSRPCYEEQVHQQVQQAKAKSKGDLSAIFNSGDTWTVS
ncbi:MAG: 2-oxoacid:ferredoxin oxidoreductase subunit beta [Planctomycetaceae bacterium]|nr:2-oxoacid:ferredoxin oxidoreductase subunit beta [Planctomycetaceae bacterium]